MNNILKVALISLIIILQSCSKEENELTSQNCDFDCTIINGRIMTDYGKTPIPDVKLTVKWDNIPYLGSGIIRTKATTKTDSDGNFFLKFLLRDEEIDVGGIYLEYEIDKTEYLSDFQKRITCYEISRDTTITIDYNIPKKAFINCHLLNLNDIQQFWRSCIKYQFRQEQ